MTTEKRKSAFDTIKGISTTIIAVAAVMAIVWKAFAEPVIDKQITEKTATFQDGNAIDHKMIIERLGNIEQGFNTLERVLYAKMTQEERSAYDQLLMNPPRRHGRTR